ncbi:MAG: DICT sensory domain-containing protein [Cyanobacteria bacterium P01_H01_bin.15]
MQVHSPLLAELLEHQPKIRPQMYFKSSLTALSHAMEDQVLAGGGPFLVIANFQQERFYRQEAERYRLMADSSAQIFVLSALETEFMNDSQRYETIAFAPSDSLAQEWHLVVLGPQEGCCLICQEKFEAAADEREDVVRDNSRRFEGIWTFERQITQQAAQLLFNRILYYRPELESQINAARSQFCEPTAQLAEKDGSEFHEPTPFVQRLVTYLQVGQYKLIKANRSLRQKEQTERLLNLTTAAMRRSLDPQEILQVGVTRLGESLQVCRCFVYRCQADDESATIEHEYHRAGITSLAGEIWPLGQNPLIQSAIAGWETVAVQAVGKDEQLTGLTPKNPWAQLIEQYQIRSWLVVPLVYQGRFLGILELHNCLAGKIEWNNDDINLIDAIATQMAVALIQAEAYTNLEDLNEQLAALDRTRSNLVAITGHELRTPLSTIQVCLESLATEPDMSLELRQVMLNTALADSERMQKLIQDFLMLSQLESGRIEWRTEPLSLRECIELSLSGVRARYRDNGLPQLQILPGEDLPWVKADGEWLVEVLSKLLDNACKFTESAGLITIAAACPDPAHLEVIISDTGRGIEPHRLERVFDRFYQEEGALRRSTGGTGLGLAICRQIVSGWGGEIWAESAGKDQGCDFHFTIPLFQSEKPKSETPKARSNGSSPSRKSRSANEQNDSTLKKRTLRKNARRNGRSAN